MIKSSFDRTAIDARSTFGQHLELKIYGTYTRNELYDLVWARPLAELRPVLGVSSTTISLACKEHRVPVPPRGYWSKVRAGQQPPKPKLPDRPPGMSNLVRLGRPRSVEVAIKDEPQPQFPLSIDPLRKEVLEVVSARLKCPKIAKTPNKRTAHIWQSMTKAVGEFDGKVIIDPKKPVDATIQLNHQKVAVWLEPSAPHSAVVANSERKTFKGLRLIIAKKACSEDIWRVWEDDELSSVEMHLSEIATEIVVLAEIQQREADARHRKWLLRQRMDQKTTKIERERVQQVAAHMENKVRLTTLLMQARDNEQAKSLQSLLDAVQDTFPSGEDTNISRWCSFVSAEIQRLDPISNMRFLEALDSEETYDHDLHNAA